MFSKILTVCPVVDATEDKGVTESKAKGCIPWGV